MACLTDLVSSAIVLSGQVDGHTALMARSGFTRADGGNSVGTVKDLIA